MDDQAKTKQQLIDELIELRQRLPKTEAGYAVTNDETKRVEAELRNSEDRLELALKAADLGMWDYNVQTGEAFINARRAEMVGYSLEEAEPTITWWGSQVHPEDLQRVRKAFNAHVKGRSPLYECEHRLRHKSGKYIWVLARAKVMEWDAQHNPVRIVGTSLDITDRKRTEEVLHQSHHELERRVQERTSELLAINRQLEQEILHRKRVNEDLRESEERYRQITENSLTGIFIHQDGVVVYANQRLADMLGYERDEMIGRQWLEAVHPEDREMVGARVLARLKGELSPVAYEVRLLKKTGEQIWCVILATRIDYRGRPAIMGNLADISDRKEAEEALRESENRYRSLVETSPDPIIVYDLEGNLLTVNQQAANAYGVESPELVLAEVKNVSEILDQDSREKAARSLRRTLATGSSRRSEYTVIRKDGSTVPVEINSSIVTRADGEPVAFISTVRDITERKRAEQSLKASEEKYRLLVENAGEAIVVAQGGMLKLVNAAAANLIGRPEDELKSQPLVNSIHPHDRNLVAQRHQQRLAGEQPPQVYSFRIIDGIGQSKWVEVNAVAITWEGSPATLNFLVDLSARRKVEEELAKIQKLESLGVLAGGIAHDFNNYLTAILGNISMARLNADSPEPASIRLAEAEKACLKAQGLTQQLLTFSRGGAPVAKSEFIGELLTESCMFALRGSSAKCEFSIQEDLWPVEVDKAQFTQVLNNLVINADQAMPQGGTIQVAAGNCNVQDSKTLSLPNGRYVKLAVTDEGVGIPEHILPRVFDPYFTTKQKGSGLGLATAFSIIKRHGGLITAESGAEEGTTFIIYLPASRKDPMPLREAAVTIPTGKGRILIMDDDEMIRDLAGKMASELGYEVEGARNGAEAVELYEAARRRLEPFDIVILDLTVPGAMGGRETAQRLREIDPNVKAIVSSGYSNDPILSDYRSYGFREVLAKPYTIRDVAQTLARLAENKS